MSPVEHDISKVGAFWDSLILIISMWKYYKQKAPGMQTILDQIGRDGLVLLAIAFPMDWM